MDKLLLTIEVPSVEQIFDFTAPKTITPGLMRELLYQVLAELTGGLHPFLRRTAVPARRPEGLAHGSIAGRQRCTDGRPSDPVLKQ